MSEDFDIEKFAEKLKKQYPTLIEDGLEGSSGAFEPDKFEEHLAEKFPELASEICAFDEESVQEAVRNTVSKKQQARDRKERLESMMNDGRELYERNRSFHDKMIKVEGPMELLAKAVTNQRRVEVRTRSAVRIDRIFEGIPMTFDEHFNIMMNDVTETVLHGRKSRQEIGLRNKFRDCLPEFLQWREGGNWPMPIGANRLIEHRFQRSCFIKGDSIVLIRCKIDG